MKKKIIDCCKMIFKSTIRAFIMTLLLFLPIFIVFVWVLGNKYEQFYDQFVDILVVLICVVTYFIAFNSVREKERYELFSSNETFNFIDEGKSFFAKEGKYILSIYSVIALSGEIYSLITAYNAQNPFAFLCSWWVPFYGVINIPILRSVIGILFASIIHLIIVEFNSYKISKKKKDIS